MESPEKEDGELGTWTYLSHNTVWGQMEATWRDGALDTLIVSMPLFWLDAPDLNKGLTSTLDTWMQNYLFFLWKKNTSKKYSVK